MQFIFSIMLFAVLTVFGGCQNASSRSSNPAEPSGDRPVKTAKTDVQPAAENADEAPRITLADAKAEFDSGNVLFVDTRSAEAFQAEHIKGAINIPADEFETRFKEVPTGKKIIAYCS